MGSLKRWYFYIVSAISLQAIVWAVIVILRNRSIDSVAFQTAVIIVGLPIFLLHYRWATRSEGEEDEYGEDHLRLLYLLTMLAAFLIPIITNSVALLGALSRTVLGIGNINPDYGWMSPPPNNEVMINSAVAILVLAVFGFYHAYLIREEKLLSDYGLPATLRRIFVFLFTAIGLTLLASGSVQTIRWLLTELSTSRIDPAFFGLTEATADLIVGLVVWLIFWRYAQKLFYSDSEEEQESALRKGYLYLVVFISTITVVSDLTIIGATQLRRLFNLEPAEDTGIVLSSLIVGALAWAYHAYVLREDSLAAPDVEAGASTRRIYWYLVAGIGLLALLGGLGGEISVVINAVGKSGVISDSLREQLSWSTAALVAGLLVWIIPWRKIQKEVELPDPAGTNARKSGVRRYYLYGFLLLATLTFLGCAIYLVYALLSNLLGISSSDFVFSDIAHAIAYATMAVLVWVYHGSILRGDDEVLQQAAPAIGEAPEIAVLDDMDGHMGLKLRSALQAAMPMAKLSAVGLTAAAREALALEDGQPQSAEILKTADIIVGPWTVATPYAGLPPEEDGAIAAVAASPAHKVLIPKAEAHWDWAGVAGWKEETAVRQAVQSVKQVAAGETVDAKKPLGAGRIILIIIGVFFLINLLFTLFSFFAGGWLY